MEVLNNRSNVYGGYQEIASLTDSLKNEMYLGTKANLTPYEMQALEMILHKIARIIYPSDPNKHYIDNWKDIAGYATLVITTLNKDEEVTKIDSKVTYKEYI